MTPLQVEVLTYAPTEFFHCLHCEVVFQTVGVGQSVHREQRAAAFPPDLQAEYDALASWVQGLVARHGGRVAVRVVDVASLEGVYKALRYRVRKFPTVVVDGRAHAAGGDFVALDRLVEERLAQPVP
jgi:hypothetical protein